MLSVRDALPRNRNRNGKNSLDIFGASLLFLLKMVKNHSIYQLATDFVIRETTASNYFYTINIFYFKNLCNIPIVQGQDGRVNQEEVDKIFRTAYNSTPVYYQEMVKDLADPANLNRTPVILNADATYIDVCSSEDLEHQKYVFYEPRSGHTIKLINFTSMIGKFLAIFPLCSSQSPSSGDAYLTTAYLQHLDNEYGRLQNYLRCILRGTSTYFCVVIVDAGFVMRSRNMPSQLQNVPSFVDICEQEGAYLLHTSDKHATYHLQRDSNGKIYKVPRDDSLLTLSENTIRFTRQFRKVEEQSHAGAKQCNKIIDAKKLSNSYLQPHSARNRRKLGLSDSFANVPKLQFIGVVACCLYNRYHPGFRLSYMDDAEQVQAANIAMRRLFQENPLVYPTIWPVQFTGRQGTQWTEITIGSLSTNDVLNFPRLPPDLINPVAIELCGGIHCILKADSLLTYIQQLYVKGRGLNRQQARDESGRFPEHMRIQYCQVRVRPSNWDDAKFGPFTPLTLVRAFIPPSNKSASTRANFHIPVIAFGDVPSDRLGLRDPYRRIYYFYCYNCPSMNGMVSFDRHLACLLKALSFRELFRSTARNIDLFNTQADDSRQLMRVLPEMSASVPFPANVPRRTANWRPNAGGITGVLYNLSQSGSSATTVTTTSAGKIFIK